VGLFLGAGLCVLNAVAAGDLLPRICWEHGGVAGTFLRCKQSLMWLVVSALLILAGVVRILRSARTVRNNSLLDLRDSAA
jgi:hypothetical protein